MKTKNEKKLQLRKQTLQDLDCVLDRNDQQKVKGGTNTDPNTNGTTQVPIYC